MSFWLRSLAIGAAVGLAAGIVIGGTLGRVLMRLVFLAQKDASGLETSMGGIVGRFTGPGTFFIYVFAAFFGLLLGLGYAAVRRLLPSGLGLRTAVFTTGATSLMLGQIARGNREDFTFLPVTLSLVLVAASVAATAAPVPFVVERLAPDLGRRAQPVRLGLVGLALAAFAVFAVTGVLGAYDA